MTAGDPNWQQCFYTESCWEVAMKGTVVQGTRLTHRWIKLRPDQNGCHFADNIFNCIFLNEDIWILHKFPLKCVPGGLMDNKSALFQAMAWHWQDNIGEPWGVCFQYSSVHNTAFFSPRNLNWHPIVNLWGWAITCVFCINLSFGNTMPDDGLAGDQNKHRPVSTYGRDSCYV